MTSKVLSYFLTALFLAACATPYNYSTVRQVVPNQHGQMWVISDQGGETVKGSLSLYLCYQPAQEGKKPVCQKAEVLDLDGKPTDIKYRLTYEAAPGAEQRKVNSDGESTGAGQFNW